MTATIFTLARSAATFLRHPLSDLIYKGHIEHDRWLRHVSVSSSIPVAVEVYKERHDGRNPPPNFHEWYKRAKETTIVDEFRQIDRDLAPFWKVPAKLLRQRAALAAGLPGVATITVKTGGEVSHSNAGNEEMKKELDELVSIISKYAQYLPEMTLPINLGAQPRILPSWDEMQSTARADLSSVVDFLHSRSVDDANDTTPAGNIETRGAGASWSFTSARALQDMHLAACPPNAKSRTNPHWRISDFCTACTRRHSKGPIVTRWDRSLEVCYQPDLYHLHSFFMTNPASPPVQELLPLFGPSKVDGFSDIIFPLPRTIAAKPDINKDFSGRHDALFWRGEVGEHAISSQALRGSHKFRLMHLTTSANPREEVTMVLPLLRTEEERKENEKKKMRDKKDEYGYERVSAIEANGALPFNFGLKDVSTGGCLGPQCDLVKMAYSAADSASQDALEHRYVLLMDEDDGPPQDLMGALRSASVPFISTTFRTWYTERLMPWMHFVPIDTRLQALHTSYAYFTGTERRSPINGRDTAMKGQLKDAEWIAGQGRKWANKALGQEDLEMYMFRLLLEWGRLIDDARDKIGFWKDDKGSLQSSGWTPRQQSMAP